MTVRKLPKGLQSFEKIRRGGYVYVDKTDFVWQIANGEQNNLLIRPRRFGKSLLTSTLKCYFEVRKELFEGLKIMELEEEWKPRQVFHFDFSGNNTARSLENYLDGVLSDYEDLLGKSSKLNLKDRFLDLMKKGMEKIQAPVAVLVDEYDSPLQHTLYNEIEHDKVRDVYKSFFPALKSGEDYIKCTFLTGITRFNQLSIFSTLNNVCLLGSKTQYATVCGLTAAEIKENFMPELIKMSEVYGWSLERTLLELREMYDGYRFSKDMEKTVYNPFSLVFALGDSHVASYWAASGGSRMLGDMIAHSETYGDTLEGCKLDNDTLERSDVSLDDVPLFLYQAGYLTHIAARSSSNPLSFNRVEN